MKRQHAIALLFLMIFTASLQAQVSWWEPEDAEPGDLLTIYYDASLGTVPANSDHINLHWGINENGAGNWIEPPESMWPNGTVSWGDGAAVQSPLNAGDNDIWSISIQTNDTTRTLHYVTTNGNDWDSNGGSNWNIILETPEPTDSTWHTFVYDTRSQYATFSTDDINYIGVAGDFNNWNGTANLLTVDDNGVYSIDLRIPAIPTSYKFVVNGNNWTADPDNPYTDGSEYGNSYLELETRDTPSFWRLQPTDGTIVPPGGSVSIAGFVHPADVEGTIGETVTVSFLGQDYNLTIDESTGAFGPQEVTIGMGMTEGAYEAEFEVTDGNNESYTARTRIGIYEGNDGFHAIDAIGDNKGPGYYTVPVIGPMEPSFDLTEVHIYESTYGDSIRFEITYNSGDDHEFARTLIQISSTIAGMEVEPSYAPIEVATPEWNGTGVQLFICETELADSSHSACNRIIVANDPYTIGAEISFDHEFFNAYGLLFFTVSVADLEAILGSYNTGWYYSIMTMREGDDGEAGIYEIGPNYGGSADGSSPDVYDIMFTDDPATQYRVLDNYSSDRIATLDNLGRGFTLINPEEIGPNVGSDGPVMRWLGHGAPTVREHWTLWGYIGSDIEQSITVVQTSDEGTVEHTVQAMTDTFSLDVTLEPGVNSFQAYVVADEDTTWSPVMNWELIRVLAPFAVFDNYIDGDRVYLDASSSYDPQSQEISYQWVSDPDNPEEIDVWNNDSDVASFEIPTISGEYYFDLTLTDPDENVTRARTLVTVYPDSVHPFTLNECAAWVDNAVVYEIFVRAYAQENVLMSIADDMQRIADLGVTAVWLTPIFPGPTAHGYEITDYYGIDSDLGTMADFDYLVEQAHAHGLKVILDLVINHSSIQHPLMRDAIAYGEYSPYFDWYDRDVHGNHEYYYDWYSLPNFNFDNPDVWHYLVKMSLWWVTEHDVDGYRCDVAWGPMERNDEFWVAWREALKTVKPEVFLLGEAGASGFSIFEDRFDLAYDWNLHHEGSASFSNMFPGPPNLNNLNTLITNYGVDWPAYKNPFRFMENHDESRYISYNTPSQTRLAAQLLLSIPGVPMIYAGQEIGVSSQRGQIPWGTDPDGVSWRYSSLLAARNQFAALRTGSYEILNNDQNSFVYTVGRYIEGEPIVVSAMNFFSSSRVPTIQLPVEEWGLDPDSTYYLSDVFGGHVYERTGANLSTIITSISSYSGKMWVIADSAYDLGVSSTPVDLPLTWSLGQNYPNPFNPSCSIEFTIPQASDVRLEVFNVLGQRVAMLTDQHFTAGQHSVMWNGTADNGLPLASGMYFYRINAGTFTATRKMMLMK